jgi:hypothetical protein
MDAQSVTWMVGFGGMDNLDRPGVVPLSLWREEEQVMSAVRFTRM